MTERDPIIEMAELRAANDQWKQDSVQLEAQLRAARTELILLSRRNTMLVIEIEDLKQEIARLHGKTKPESRYAFNDVQAMDDRRGP